MSCERLSASETREIEPMLDPSQIEEAAKDFQGLVEKIHEWAAACYIHHGQFPEVGGADPLRGFMRWLRRERAIEAAAGPHGKQWPSTQITHQQGTCWCGFLSSSEKARMAAEGTISAHDAVSRLSCDDDPDEDLRRDLDYNYKCAGPYCGDPHCGECLL